MRQDLTFVAVILDRSASMRGVTDDTIAGFNSFLEEQQALPGEVLFTLVQFAEDSFTAASAIPISQVKPLTRETYQATGAGTALYDAIGRTVDSVGAQLAALPEYQRPGRVLVMIQTDGQENSSRYYTRDRIANMIKHQRQKYSWDFVFIGATEQAVADAATFGVQAGWAGQYAATPEGTSRMLRDVSGSVARYRHEVATNGTLGANFKFFEP